MSYLLETLTKKEEIDNLIRNTIDKVLVLRIGRASDIVCMQLDEIGLGCLVELKREKEEQMTSMLPPAFHLRGIVLQLAKSMRDVSKFASIGLVDADAPEIQLYIKYFDISLIPATIFFFNAHHMKMDSGTPDHTKWIGAFHSKQDFIDVVEVIFRGAMKGKLIVTCPLPQDRVPKFELLYKNY